MLTTKKIKLAYCAYAPTRQSEIGLAKLLRVAYAKLSAKRGGICNSDQQEHTDDSKKERVSTNFEL
jgi:hypothetical protein